MFAIIGIVVVLGSVIGGYLMGHGNLSVLIQPAELIIIFGSALGSLFIASPSKVVKLVFRDITTVLSEGKINKATYLELLILLNQIFWKIRKDGLLSIEGDIETPENSELFKKFPSIMSNHEAIHFICDNFRVIVTTNMSPHELDNLLDVDIEAHHHEMMIAPTSIAKVADSLPGLGIVAAVLGVVLTMGMLSEPPEVLGHHIGAALVGTFVGVLACYGFVAPMASNLEHKAADHTTYFSVIKSALVSFVGGSPPQIAVESGRRAIPGDDRPSFSELEEEIKKWKDKA